MPRYRKLHVKTVESLDINAMPDDFTRLLWVLLPLQLCKYGRGIYSAAWVRSKVFPLREDVTQEMVGAALEWFAARGMLVPYQVEGRDYFYLPSFLRYQGNTLKEMESDYPEPPDLLQTNSGVTPELVESKSVTDADADAAVDADAEVDAAAATMTAAASMLGEWGVSRRDSAALIQEYGKDEVVAMYCLVAGKPNIDNRAGLLISKLKNGDRAPPPAPDDDDWRRFTKSEYAEYIDGGG